MIDWGPRNLASVLRWIIASDINNSPGRSDLFDYTQVDMVNKHLLSHLWLGPYFRYFSDAIYFLLRDIVVL